MADLVLAWDAEAGAPLEVTAAQAHERGLPVIVSDAASPDRMLAVPVTEAAEGRLRYARTLAPGSAERAETERQALAVLEECGSYPPWRKRG